LAAAVLVAIQAQAAMEVIFLQVTHLRYPQQQAQAAAAVVVVKVLAAAVSDCWEKEALVLRVPMLAQSPPAVVAQAAVAAAAAVVVEVMAVAAVLEIRAEQAVAVQ